jgi:hypothetical protein
MRSKFRRWRALPSIQRVPMEQVSQIPATHLILLLDDFLLQAPVNASRLSMLVSQTHRPPSRAGQIDIEFGLLIVVPL